MRNVLLYVYDLLRGRLVRSPTHVELVIVAITSAGMPEVVSRLRVSPVEYLDGGAVVVVRLQRIVENLMKGS